jgi:hypothetical protein
MFIDVSEGHITFVFRVEDSDDYVKTEQRIPLSPKFSKQVAA